MTEGNEFDSFRKTTEGTDALPESSDTQNNWENDSMIVGLRQELVHALQAYRNFDVSNDNPSSDAEQEQLRQDILRIEREINERIAAISGDTSNKIASVLAE